MTEVDWKDTALFSSADGEGGSDEWGTPRKYWNMIARRLGGFDLDAATSEDAPKIAPVGFTKEDDALSQRWDVNGPDGAVDGWLNPPYSLADEFLEKARSEYLQRDGIRSITILIPARLDTSYYHSVADVVELEVSIGPGRIDFIPMTEEQHGENGSTFPSVYLIMAPRDVADDLRPTLERLGVVKRVVSPSGPAQGRLGEWEA